MEQHQCESGIAASATRAARHDPAAVEVTPTQHRVWRALDDRDLFAIARHLRMKAPRVRAHLENLERNGLAVAIRDSPSAAHWKWRRHPARLAVASNGTVTRQCIGKNDFGERCESVVASTGPGHRMCERCRRQGANPYDL